MLLEGAQERVPQCVLRDGLEHELVCAGRARLLGELRLAGGGEKFLEVRQPFLLFFRLAVFEDLAIAARENLGPGEERGRRVDAVR